MSPNDQRWTWLTYGTAFVPLIGQPIVVIASSVLYYRWRRRWPEAARRVNRNAWIAVALNIALTLGARYVVRRCGWS